MYNFSETRFTFIFCNIFFKDLSLYSKLYILIANVITFCHHKFGNVNFISNRKSFFSVLKKYKYSIVRLFIKISGNS